MKSIDIVCLIHYINDEFMNEFEGFTREEVIRSDNSKIAGDAVLDEPYPCED